MGANPLLIGAAALLLPADCRGSDREPLANFSVGIEPGAFGPVATGTGFARDGYFVWCGSVIKIGDAYEMFASRWPTSTKFPEGYRQHSEIVRAEASKPEGPCTLVNGSLWVTAKVEDFFLFRKGSAYPLICEDYAGKHTWNQPVAPAALPVEE